jgi:hypothetical protein
MQSWNLVEISLICLMISAYYEIGRARGQLRRLRQTVQLWARYSRKFYNYLFLDGFLDNWSCSIFDRGKAAGRITTQPCRRGLNPDQGLFNLQQVGLGRGQEDFLIL